MNRNTVEAYARKARRDFIASVTDRAAFLGLNASHIEPIKEMGDVSIIGAHAFPRHVAKSRKRLEERISQAGFEQVMESIAYTWFNRFAAIRFMELHGYLDHGYRVLSHPEGKLYPEILDHAATVDLAVLDRKIVLELKVDGSKDEELYRLLLLAQCNALHQAMPFLFASIGDETELLLPANLLHTDSLIYQMVAYIDESDWGQIEIIGWLYQYYISEKKEQVIGDVVASENIPAATQLFTPNWIVKYLVQNSLGAMWMATYPKSKLKDQMEYYIEPAVQSDEVVAQLAGTIPRALDPEALTLIDPASGSGHILVEAYNLLKSIYLERGYRQRDVASLILEKNLFGLDIDERAAQLTGFALMMKGRADDRRLFERGVKLNVMAFLDSTGFDTERLAQSVTLADHRIASSDLKRLKQLFAQASTLGSLIQIPEELDSRLPTIKELSEVTSQDLFVSNALTQLASLVQQAEMLATKYDAVIANPPYMGNRGMNAVLKTYVKDHYPDSKSDLFACFIERGFLLVKDLGHNAMITMQSWMFLSSFEKLREWMLRNKTIKTMAHLGPRAFGSISGEVVQTTACVLQNRSPHCYKPVFFRLLDGGESEKQTALANGWRRFDTAAQDEFKKIPGSPVAYWIQTTHPFDGARIYHAFGSGGRTKTHGNQIYLRFWWEVGRQSGIWAPYANGGDYRKYAGNILEVVNWSSSARRFYESHGGLYSQKYWSKTGITWGLISSARTSFRLKPSEAHYSSGAPTIFENSFHTDYVVLGFLNSPIANLYLTAMNPTINTTVNDVLGLPLPSHFEFPEIVTNVGNEIELSQDDWDAYERSRGFHTIPILTTSSTTLESSYTAWIAQNRKTITEMKRLEEENNRLFIEAYGLQNELTPDVPIEQITLTVNPAYRYGGELTEEKQGIRFRQDTMKELVSYAIGCMMGRYSLDKPGLIYALSADKNFDPCNYTTFHADPDGILPLTDSDWFDDDAVHRLIEFISVAWDAVHLEDNLSFLANYLSPKKNETSRETLRRYLCDRFYKDHLQTYKKRPIYWLFSSGKHKAFQCLVYLHRYNENTLARMRTEYVIPLQGMMASRIRSLDEDIATVDSTAFRKRLEKERTDLVKKQPELQEFDEKLRHYTDQQITLDLDDGVRVNYGKFDGLLADAKTIMGAKPG